MKFLKVSGFILAVGVFASVAIGEPLVSPVINGEDAAVGEFPWIATIFSASSTPEDPREGSFCGGALIAPQFVLTAAHCVQSIRDYPGDYLVGVGALKLDDPALLVRAIKGVIEHPQYNSYTKEHDLALVKLDQPVDLPLLELATSAEYSTLVSGSITTILGWGQADANYPVLPNDLQTAEIPWFSDDDCMDQIGRYYDPETMLCAGKVASSSVSDDGVDTCYGDSGTPILMSVSSGGQSIYKAVGVTSWGFGCASKIPGVYAELDKDREWLLSEPLISPSFNGYSYVVQSATDNAGALLVGSTIECENSGDVIGEDVSVSYRWYLMDDYYSDDVTDFDEVPGEISKSLTISRSMSGRYVSCLIQAENSSGVATIRSDGYFVSNESIPSVDVTAPEITSARSICKGRRCEVILGVDDGENSSGIAQVQSSFSFRRAGCSSTGNAECPAGIQSGNLYATHKAGKRWRSDVVIKSAKGYLTLRAFATDAAGNVGKAKKFKLKIGLSGRSKVKR